MTDSDKSIADLEPNGDEEGEEIASFVEAIQNPDEFYAKNAFRVIYQTNNFLLPQVRDLINGKQVINIRPEYQRRLRWSTPQKSKLIESLLLNIPVPPVFFYESEAARYEVMDGQQRLNAIKEFLNNEFKLSSLTVLWPLNGLTYATCPPRIKRGLDRAVVSAIVLLLESDVDTVEGKNISHSDIRRFIFERLNTGGKRLNAQELRNAIYPGCFNEMIIQAARNSLFTDVWGIPTYENSDPNEYYENPKRQRNALYSSMKDCEIVLRFFALRDEQHIRGSMKGILDRCMERHLEISVEQADELLQVFVDRLETANEIFDQAPFELLPDERGRTRMSIALYDAVMVAVDRLWNRRDEMMAAAPQIRSAVTDLLSDEDTSTLITGQGNTAKTTKDRIDLVSYAFESVL